MPVTRGSLSKRGGGGIPQDRGRLWAERSGHQTPHDRYPLRGETSGRISACKFGTRIRLSPGSRARSQERTSSADSDKDPTGLIIRVSSDGKRKRGFVLLCKYRYNLILFRENEIREIRVSLRRVITRTLFSTMVLRARAHSVILRNFVASPAPSAWRATGNA